MKKYNSVLEEESFVSKTVPNVKRSRLSRIVPMNDVTFKEACDKNLCWHCRDREATKNFSTYCARCWFYMQNEYNDVMYEEPAKPIEFTV